MAEAEAVGDTRKIYKIVDKLTNKKQKPEPNLTTDGQGQTLGDANDVAKRWWAFLKNKREKLGAKGLWAIWRFPNYIGEVLFWWGLFLIGIEAAPSHWQILIGPAVMTALFHFISMPLMEERHRLKRPEYYRELLLRPRWIPAFRSSVKDKC